MPMRRRAGVGVGVGAGAGAATKTGTTTKTRAGTATRTGEGMAIKTGAGTVSKTGAGTVSKTGAGTVSKTGSAAGTGAGTVGTGTEVASGGVRLQPDITAQHMRVRRWLTAISTANPVLMTASPPPCDTPACAVGVQPIIPRSASSTSTSTSTSTSLDASNSSSRRSNPSSVPRRSVVATSDAHLPPVPPRACCARPHDDGSNKNIQHHSHNNYNNNNNNNNNNYDDNNNNGGGRQQQQQQQLPLVQIDASCSPTSSPLISSSPSPSHNSVQLQPQTQSPRLSKRARPRSPSTRLQSSALTPHHSLLPSPPSIIPLPSHSSAHPRSPVSTPNPATAISPTPRHSLLPVPPPILPALVPSPAPVSPRLADPRLPPPPPLLQQQPSSSPTHVSLQRDIPSVSKQQRRQQQQQQPTVSASNSITTCSVALPVASPATGVVGNVTAVPHASGNMTCRPLRAVPCPPSDLFVDTDANASRQPLVPPSSDRTASQRVLSYTSQTSRCFSGVGVVAHPVYLRRPSDRLAAVLSDFGSDFERVTSEQMTHSHHHPSLLHANAIASNAGRPNFNAFSTNAASAASDSFAFNSSVAHLSENRSDLTAPGLPPPSINQSASGNQQLPTLPLVFNSVVSYGNTEQSFLSREDSNILSGGFHRQSSAIDNSNSGNSLRRSLLWNAVPCLLSSKVADAAGSLYRSGSVEDRWVIGHGLGKGACSVVQLGKERNGSRQVAVKIVCKSAPDLFSPNGECREVVAFKIAGHHANVVTCHEIYEDQGFIYLILELLDGGPLLNRVSEKKFYPHYCENDVTNLIRGLTRGLAHLHALGIAHRDVKPENVLFASKTWDPSIKLTDFGIAHTQCLTNEARDMVGTPLYVAPEVLLRKPYGCQADMWSLGVIVHILLTGHPPFDDDDLVQLVNKVKFDPVKMDGSEWASISEDGRDFVRRLLSREVSKRLTAEKALAHTWLSAPRPPPFPAPPSERKSTSEKWNDVDARSRDGSVQLAVAQANLHTLIRREWTKTVHQKPLENKVELSMLVSLSEKDLKIPESFTSRDESSDNRRVASTPPANTSSGGRDAVRAHHPTNVRSPTSEGISNDSILDKSGKGDTAGGSIPKRRRRKSKCRGMSLDAVLALDQPEEDGNGAPTNRVERGRILQKRRVTDAHTMLSSRPPAKLDGQTAVDSESKTQNETSSRQARHDLFVRKPRKHARDSKSVPPSARANTAVGIEHEQEQERLRRRRLQLQAHLVKKRQSEGKRTSADGNMIAGAEDATSSAGGTVQSHGGRVDAQSSRSIRTSARRRTDGTSVPTGSLSSCNLSSSSSASDPAESKSSFSVDNNVYHQKGSGGGSLTHGSKLSEESGRAEWLRERRQADAHDDAAAIICKQRGGSEESRQARPTLMGRKARQSAERASGASGKDRAGERERSKSRTRIKRVGLLRRHKREKSKLEDTILR